MKYEPIFGDQSLFDKATRKNTVAIYKISENLTVEFDKYEALLAFLQQQPLCDRPDIAMRIIIKEPKRWTVEDQRAGRLPEVGCFVEYFKNNKHGNTEVTAQWRNGDELEILRHQNKNKAFVVFNARTEESSDLIVQCMKPIETPEEKAARLREEWCSNALDSASILSGMREYELKRLGGYIGNIYDAILSGELPVPVKGGE